MRKACLGATIAVAWAGSSAPAIADGPEFVSDTVYIRTSFFHSVSHAHFVAFNSLTFLDIDIGAMPAGNAFTSVTLGTGSGSSFAVDRYAIVGAAHLTHLTRLGIMMGFNSGPSVNGQAFESIFPGSSEAQVMDALLTSSPALDQFFSRMPTSPVSLLTVDAPSAYDAFHFSNATPFGTIQASFSPIPEPVSGMVCLGALGFGMITRRRG